MFGYTISDEMNKCQELFYMVWDLRHCTLGTDIKNFLKGGPHSQYLIVIMVHGYEILSNYITGHVLIFHNQHYANEKCAEISIRYKQN